MQRLFAGIPVRDFEAALDWYARLFDRAPDVVAHEHEVLWQVAGTGWVYVIKDDDRAGHSLLAFLVSDLETTRKDVEQRGISIGPIEKEGEAGYKATAIDPDGNSVSFIAVSS